MKYILDTDTISYFLAGKETGVIKKFRELDPRDIATTAVNSAELLYGASRKYSKRSKKFGVVAEFLSKLETHPFDSSSAEIFSKLKAELTRKGRSIADLDLMIASITISNGATLVTHNTKHFSRIRGLRLEDWV